MKQDYIEYLAVLKDSMGRQGVQIEGNLQDDTYLREYIDVIDQYSFFNECLKLCNSSAQIASYFGNTEKTLFEYLRDKYYDKYLREWSYEYDALLEQPKEAGKCIYNFDVVSDVEVRLFTESLNLKSNLNTSNKVISANINVETNTKSNEQDDNILDHIDDIDTSTYFNNTMGVAGIDFKDDEDEVLDISQMGTYDWDLDEDTSFADAPEDEAEIIDNINDSELSEIGNLDEDYSIFDSSQEISDFGEDEDEDDIENYQFSAECLPENNNALSLLPADLLAQLHMEDEDIDFSDFKTDDDIEEESMYNTHLKEEDYFDEYTDEAIAELLAEVEEELQEELERQENRETPMLLRQPMPNLYTSSNVSKTKSRQFKGSTDYTERQTTKEADLVVNALNKGLNSLFGIK